MIARRRAVLRGRLQGVGFRPFVANLARRCELGGCVANDGDGVVIEVEGPAAAIDRFADRLVRERPAASAIEGQAWDDIARRGCTEFRIVASQPGRGPGRISLSPDLKVCDDCLREIGDPTDRRFGHPFATCCACGPRLSLATSLPYDRERTTMAAFDPCGACSAECGDPTDRRYHAQALACPNCGPRLALLDPNGRPLARDHAAIEGAVEALRRGRIVALKGVGGYQLLVDATSEPAVARLRARKRREFKPLAVMVRDVAMARRLARVDAVAAAALESAAGPIVLVDGLGLGLARGVAPGRSRLGLMLPTTPLHALVLERFEGPVVATSGNVHDEPIAIDDATALQRLGPVADALLVHDRRIVRRSDDSVVQVVAGTARILRLGRGFAPTRIPMPTVTEPIVALGGHLKQAPVLARDGEAVLWPHVGDLFELTAREAMREAVADLERLSGCEASVLAVDAHPDYATTQFAEQSGRRVQPVWHHHAHVAAVMAEHGLDDALGLAWDGVGLGPDGTAWGGEVLDVSPIGARRVGHIVPFPLPGGDAAARDGRRPLAGMLVAARLQPPDEMTELDRLCAVAADTRLCGTTTSVGRLFDAVAALVGVCSRSRYEAEAASRLEELVDTTLPAPYPFRTQRWAPGASGIDWRPALAAMIDERHDPVRVAGRFHATLAAMAVDAVEHSGAQTVVLGGGCFQNRTLAEAVLAGLRDRGVRALLPERAAVSDGGLALGQAWVVSARGPR